jgi:hypothetical protein
MSRYPRLRPAGGRGDTMELLARARPDRLDSDPAAAPPAASFIGSGPATAAAAGVTGPAAAAAAVSSADERGQRPDGASPGPAPVPPARPPGRARRRRYLAAGLAATAAAALAAGLTVAAGGHPARPPAAGPAVAGPSAARPASGRGGPPSGSAAPVPSARAVLLTAAVHAAQVPVTGRYWRIVLRSGSVHAAGPNAHPYAVLRRWSPAAYWDSRSAARPSWTLPSAGWTTRPASAGAAAAWRAAGSRPLRAHRGRQQAWWQTGGAVGYLGNGNLTFAQFRSLPSAPGRLAAVVRRAARAQNKAGVPAGMFSIYDQLLKWDPIAPRVRAAVFRDLAALPGVRSAGRVTDPLGRPGYGIEMTGTGPSGEREVLVIAPGTGSLLADEFLTTTAPRPLAPGGARPGPTSCPRGTRLVMRGVCRSGVITRHGHQVIDEFSLGPQLALPRGSLVSYDAVVRAGWTSAQPRLPAPSERFSVATDGRG